MSSGDFGENGKSGGLPGVDDGGLRHFLIPKGDITPEHQMFLINANNIKDRIGEKLNGKEVVDTAEKSRFSRTLKDLEHVRRFLQGQPYHKESAIDGLDHILDEIAERKINADDDPDDAAAAENEMFLYYKLQDQLMKS